MDGTGRSVEAASTAVFGQDGGQAQALATVWSALGLEAGSPVRIAVTAGIRYSGVGSGPEIFDWVEALGSQIGESVLAVGDSTRGVSYAPERLRSTVDAVAAAAGVEVERLELPPVALVRVLAPGATCSLAFESGVGWRARMHSGRLLEASVYPDGSVPAGITVSAPGHGSRPLETLHRIDVADGLGPSAADLAIAVGAARGLIEPGSGANLAPLDAASGVADPRPPSLPAHPQSNGATPSVADAEAPGDARSVADAPVTGDAQPVADAQVVAEARPEPAPVAAAGETAATADAPVAAGSESPGEPTNGAVVTSAGQPAAPPAASEPSVTEATSASAAPSAERATSVAAAPSTEQAGWALPSPVEIEMWPSGDGVGSPADAEASGSAPTTPDEAPTVPPMPPASSPGTTPAPTPTLAPAAANGAPAVPPHPADLKAEGEPPAPAESDPVDAPDVPAPPDAATRAGTAPIEADAVVSGGSGRSRRGEPADRGTDRVDPGAVDGGATVRRPPPMPDPLPTGDPDSSPTPTADGGDPHGWPTARPPAPPVAPTPPPTPPMPPPASPAPSPESAAPDGDEHDPAATVPPAPAPAADEQTQPAEPGIPEVPDGPSFSPGTDGSNLESAPRLVPPDPPSWSAPGEPEATEPVEQDTILPGRAAFGPVPEHRRRPRSGGGPGSDRGKPPLRQRPGGRAGTGAGEAPAPTPDIEPVPAPIEGRSTVGWLKLVVLALFVLALALTALLFVW